MGIGTMLNNAALHYHLLILPSPNRFLGPQNFKAALYVYPPINEAYGRMLGKPSSTYNHSEYKRGCFGQ